MLLHDNEVHCVTYTGEICTMPLVGGLLFFHLHALVLTLGFVLSFAPIILKPVIFLSFWILSSFAYHKDLLKRFGKEIDH